MWAINQYNMKNRRADWRPHERTIIGKIGFFITNTIFHTAGDNRLISIDKEIRGHYSHSVEIVSCTIALDVHTHEISYNLFVVFTYEIKHRPKSHYTVMCVIVEPDSTPHPWYPSYTRRAQYNLSNEIFMTELWRRSWWSRVFFSNFQNRFSRNNWPIGRVKRSRFKNSPARK